PYRIGTGGVIVHSENPKHILEAGKFNPNEPIYLKPENPKYMVDKTYILSSMGLLAQKEPDLAVKIMKKYLIEV
ncbi:MAG: glutamate mutase L, partial [Cetobacterium sp.]